MVEVGKVIEVTKERKTELPMWKRNGGNGCGDCIVLEIHNFWGLIVLDNVDWLDLQTVG